MATKNVHFQIGNEQAMKIKAQILYKHEMTSHIINSIP